MTYDKNGNISTLLRNGFIDGNSAGMTYPIDALTYTYKPNSNQLEGIYDSTSSNDGFKDANPTAEDFRYDEFGNLIRDHNKGITSILYNHLNLPTKIKFKYDETNQINYLYNALGIKVGKQVRVTALQSSTIETQTDYLNGFQYVDNVLEFFPTAEGYVSVTNGDKFNYVYNYTDHLGNIRLSYSVDPSDQEVKIMEENHYYPFGLKHVNYNVTRVQFARDEVGTYVVLRPVDRGKYQYKYNGKELQDELGLNMYDYGARMYDPARAGWTTIDPLAEKMRRWSPYNYCFNNPMRFTDPDGMGPTDWYQNKVTGNIQWFNGSGAKAGYDNIGTTTNVVAGTGQALQLNSNGTATDMNSGKSIGANKTVVVNSSTGTTVKTISASEGLANTGKASDVVGGVAAPLAKYGSTSNIASQTFAATVKGAEVSDNAVAGLATLGNASQFQGIAKGLGTAAPFVSAGVGALQIQEGYNMDGGTFGPNAQSATAGAVGSAVGGYAGAEAGAAVGAAIGVWFGGVGAVPGAIIGGIIGGIGGGMAGEAIGKEIVK